MRSPRLRADSPETWSWTAGDVEAPPAVRDRPVEDGLGRGEHRRVQAGPVAAASICSRIGCSVSTGPGAGDQRPLLHQRPALLPDGGRRDRVVQGALHQRPGRARCAGPAPSPRRPRRCARPSACSRRTSGGRRCRTRRCRPRARRSRRAPAGPRRRSSGRRRRTRWPAAGATMPGLPLIGQSSRSPPCARTASPELDLRPASIVLISMCTVPGRIVVSVPAGPQMTSSTSPRRGRIESSTSARSATSAAERAAKVPPAAASSGDG